MNTTAVSINTCAARSMLTVNVGAAVLASIALGQTVRRLRLCLGIRPLCAAARTALLVRQEENME